MRDDLHADELYGKLENSVLPCFYESPWSMHEIRRATVALNGSTYNTHRMVLQYLFEAYRDPAEPPLWGDADDESDRG
jgi:starch phosphorylase